VSRFDRADARNRSTNSRGETINEQLQRHLPVFAAAAAGCMALAVPASAQQTTESICSSGPILTMNDMAMLVAFGAHRGALDDGCAHDAMLRMTAVMAGGRAGR
jgi:hypothetical protein